MSYRHKKAVLVAVEFGLAMFTVLTGISAMAGFMGLLVEGMLFTGPALFLVPFCGLPVLTAVALAAVVINEKKIIANWR